MLVGCVHNSLGSGRWVSRSIVDQEVAVLVVLLVELLHVVLAVGRLPRLMREVAKGGVMRGIMMGDIMMGGSVMGRRRLAGRQVSVSCRWDCKEGEGNEGLTTSLRRRASGMYVELVRGYD